MRLNPAYNAVLDLQKIIPQVQFKKNKDNASYCMIHLPPNDSELTGAGTSYRPETVAHLSIYQWYNNTETHGLSVFHYTWQGFIEDDNGRTSVVLHVYFDRIGRYLNCQLKNRKTNEVIQPLSTAEEKNIKQYATMHAQETLTNLLQYIAKSYMEADKIVTQYLDELDTLSQHIETQYPKYKKVANECIKSMHLKDKWSFNEKDSRAILLEQITGIFEEQCNTKSSITEKKQSFYSQTTAQNTPKKQAVAKKKKLISQPLSPEILQQLEDIEKALDDNTTRNDITQAQKTLMTLELLNKKFDVLAKGKTTSLLENKLIQTLQQINSQYKDIAFLFQDSAINADLESVKTLKPYIASIDIFFFAELLNKGDLAMCQFMMEHFDDCLLYLNFCALGQSKNGTQMLEKSSILLEIAIHCHDSPLLLEMLLQQGGNPNYYGATSQNHKGILQLAIIEEKEAFVKVCLENGAEPNPDTSTVICKSAMPKVKDILTKTDISNTYRSLGKQKGNSYINQAIPLENAIYLRNKAIIKLLLQHGASVIKQNETQFDAIGQECCSNVYTPDREILSLLIKHGANINAPQGDNDNQTTALLFACQRGCLNSVKMLIELGADPNQLLINKARTKRDDNQILDFYLPITPLQKALFKEHYDLVDFLITQTFQPVTFTTAATCFAFFQSNQKEVFLDSKTLGFKLSDSLIQLKNKLTGSFDEKTIALETKTLLKQGEQYFAAKQYVIARAYFRAVLEFGDQSNRHGMLYNLASCHKSFGEIEIATHLYELCVEHAPTSQIGQFAAKQLEKLHGPITLHMQQGKRI